MHFYHIEFTSPQNLSYINMKLVNISWRMRNYSDICFCVPTMDTPRIQEVHIMLGHIICELLEKKLYGDKNEL